MKYIWVQAPFKANPRILNGTGRSLDGVSVRPDQTVCWHISTNERGQPVVTGYTIIDVSTKGEEFNV